MVSACDRLQVHVNNPMSVSVLSPLSRGFGYIFVYIAHAVGFATIMFGIGRRLSAQRRSTIDNFFIAPRTPYAVALAAGTFPAAAMVGAILYLILRPVIYLRRCCLLAHPSYCLCVAMLVFVSPLSVGAKGHQRSRTVPLRRKYQQQPPRQRYAYHAICGRSERSRFCQTPDTILHTFAFASVSIRIWFFISLPAQMLWRWWNDRRFGWLHNLPLDLAFV